MIVASSPSHRLLFRFLENLLPLTQWIVIMDRQSPSIFTASARAQSPKAVYPAVQLAGKNSNTDLATHRVRLADAVDQSSILSGLVLAFANDPVIRWLYPDPYQFLNHFPGFIKAFGGRAFEQNTTYIVDVSIADSVEAAVGAALWLAPGIEPDAESFAAHLQQSLFSAQLADAFGVLEQIDRYHPAEPHWYLPILGVEPARQRRGLGSALMKPILQQCDRDRLPAYLESSNIANVALYERQGFEVIGTIQAGSSPTIYPMYRQPQ